MSTTTSPLDEAQLAALTRLLAPLPGMGSALRVEKVGGGFSNITLLVTGESDDVIVRMPPPGAAHIQSGHNVVREARLLQKLAHSYPLAPLPLLIVDDTSALGVPFFVMPRVHGRVLRNKVPKDVELSPAVMRALSTSFIDGLAALHALRVDDAGLHDVGHPAGYVQRQVEGWRARYEKSKTDEVSDMERLSSWLADNVPVEPVPAPATIVHNDYKFDNLVLDDKNPARIVGVLDWELATVGDPMTDLGTSLAYWVEANDDDTVRMLPLGLTHLSGNLTRLELVQRYEQQTRQPVRDLLFHVVLASFKIAVIAQQIYYRFHKGFTTDPRFAGLGFAVAVIAARACRMLDAQRIDVP